jgi:hypothetical protein
MRNRLGKSALARWSSADHWPVKGLIDSQGARAVNLVLKLNALAVFMAFAFVSAVVVGAF